MPREYYTPKQWGERYKPKKAEGKYIEAIAAVVFITSILLVIWSISIYRQTLIDWQKLIIPSAIGSIAFTIAFFKSLYTEKNGKYGSLFICVVCGGCLANFAFMYTNKALADDENLRMTLPVVHKGILSGKGHNPYVVVRFNDIEKQVMIDWEKKPGHSKLDLEYAEGGLGYYVIKKKELVR